MSAKPYIIDFQQHGKPEEGFLTVGSRNDEIPFKIERVFWTYHTPTSVTRGRHAHYTTEMIIIAANGTIEVSTISSENEKNHFELANPNRGLYIPVMCWHEMSYSEDAVQVVIASTKYSERDYIRSLASFNALIRNT